MRYENLSLTAFVSEVKEVSNGPYTRKFCFILGAGASISSGIKSGQELVTIWDKELFERNGEEHLKWKHNVVITTNFDHLMEDAVNYYAHTIPMVIGHEFLASYVTRQIARPTIIKIHRDLLFDPKNRTEELEELHDNWKKTLSEVFSDYHPVFIGYAGNDNSLMNFLLENSEKFLEGEWKYPYWMIYYKEAVGGKVLEFLESTEG